MASDVATELEHGANGSTPSPSVGFLEYVKASWPGFPHYQPFGDWSTGYKTALERLALMSQVQANAFVGRASHEFRVDADTGCSPADMSIIFRHPGRLAIYDVKGGTKLLRITSRESGEEKSFYLPDGGENIALHLGSLFDSFFDLSANSRK